MKSKGPRDEPLDNVTTTLNFSLCWAVSQFFGALLQIFQQLFVRIVFVLSTLGMVFLFSFQLVPLRCVMSFQYAHLLFFLLLSAFPFKQSCLTLKLFFINLPFFYIPQLSLGRQPCRLDNLIPVTEPGADILTANHFAGIGCIAKFQCCLTNIR